MANYKDIKYDFSGENLTALNATQLTSGTTPDARYTTLPAVSGANLTSLTATNLSSGTVPTARLGTGTASSSVFLAGDNTWAAAAGGGKVLQVDTDSTTLVDTTLSAAITPSATSSKVLCLISQNVSHNGRAIGRLVLLRTTTNIYDTIQIGDADDQRTLHFGVFLDSPSTTSATTYKTQMARFDQSGTINIQRNDSGSAGKSTIILAEIGA